MKSDDDSIEAGARQFCDFLDEVARSTLKPTNDKILADNDRKDLEFALAILRPAFEGCLQRMIAPVTTEELHTSPFLCGPDGLNQLLGAAFIIGRLGGETDTAKNFYGNKHGGDGGKASGDARNLKAEEWRVPAKALAKEICSRGPITQENLKEAIEDEWTIPIHCPSSMLLGEIRKWEDAGELKREKPRRKAARPK